MGEIYSKIFDRIIYSIFESKTSKTESYWEILNQNFLLSAAVYVYWISTYLTYYSFAIVIYNGSFIYYVTKFCNRIFFVIGNQWTEIALKL